MDVILPFMSGVQDELTPEVRRFLDMVTAFELRSD